MTSVSIFLSGKRSTVHDPVQEILSVQKQQAMRAGIPRLTGLCNDAMERKTCHFCHVVT